MRLHDFPFSRAIMFYGRLFYLQSALIRRKVLDLGSRFDEGFEISEDRISERRLPSSQNLSPCATLDSTMLRSLEYPGPVWGNTGTRFGSRFEQSLRYNTLLEAMSMELPVIMFSGDMGGAELIEHGKDGFLVETEEEALDRLAASPELRQSSGQAARRKVLATLDGQQERMPDFYLRTSAMTE